MPSWSTRSYLLTLDLDRPVGEKIPSGSAPTSYPTAAATRIRPPFSPPTNRLGTCGWGRASGWACPIVPINGFAVYNMGDR